MTLWYNELAQHIDVDELYKNFTCLKLHHKDIRAFLAEYTGTSVKESKKELIKVVHMGRPKYEIPFLWDLSVEIRQAAEDLLGLPKFEYLQGLFEDRRRPLASKLHYALASIEDAILSDMELELGAIPSLSYNTYMFDEAIVLVGRDELEELTTRLRHVGDRRQISCTIEVW